jgi:kynurenine formamidase
MKNGSIANNSEMKLPTHTGTHVDAPGHVFDHYFDAGFDVDSLDLHILNGFIFFSILVISFQFSCSFYLCFILSFVLFM